MAGERSFEGSEEGVALLAQRREVAAQDTEGIRTGPRAEGAGDLLLHLDHAQVAFGLVVVEGNGEVIEEGQHLVLIEPEPIQQIARGRLLAPTSAPGRG